MNIPGWSSLETVSFIQNLLTILSYVSLGLLLAFEVGAHFYENRKEALQAELSRVKDAEVQTLKTELRTERNILRALSAVVNIRFQGKWNEADLPFTDASFMAPPGDTQFLQMVANLNGEARYVNLYGTKMYKFFRQEPGHYVFAVDLALKSDDLLLGHSIESLSEIITMGAVVFLPISFPNKLHDPSITVTSVLLDFTVNYQQRITKEFTVNATIKPTQIPDSRFVPVAVPLKGSDFVN